MGDRFSRMSPTFRLFALPSFFKGIGSVIDLRGSFHIYHYNKSDEEADVESLRADWRAVGNDLRSAMDVADRELARR